MAVFLAAADESEAGDQSGPFVYGGFVAPVLDWINVVSPVWRARVLNRTPCINCFHTAEIKSKSWQAKNGFTEAQAEARIDAAVSVIADVPSLHVARAKVDGGHFRQLFGRSRVVRQGRQYATYRLDPDYVGFLGFARGALEHVHDNHPDAERVDFIVEKKTTVTHYLPDYLEMLKDWARRERRHALLTLIGRLMPGDKSCVELQAADLAMWHIRRHEANESDPHDIRRLSAMFDGRKMTLNQVTNDELSAIAARARDLKWRESVTDKR